MDLAVRKDSVCWPIALSLSRTCGEYFPVADMWGGGHSRRSDGTIFIRMPPFTNTKLPGLTRSRTRAAFSEVISSPGPQALFARNRTDLAETHVYEDFHL